MFCMTGFNCALGLCVADYGECILPIFWRSITPLVDYFEIGLLGVAFSGGPSVSIGFCSRSELSFISYGRLNCMLISYTGFFLASAYLREVTFTSQSCIVCWLRLAKLLPDPAFKEARLVDGPLLAWSFTICDYSMVVCPPLRSDICFDTDSMKFKGFLAIELALFS